MLMTQPRLRYIGGRRFGAWLTRGHCAEHGQPFSGVSRGPRFVEVSLAGRTVGACW